MLLVGIGRRRLVALPRQVDAERGAAPELAVHRDAAAEVGDDAVHQRQPEPGADADLLGREERIEDALEHLRRDAAAGIADREADVARRPAACWSTPSAACRASTPRRVTVSTPSRLHRVHGVGAQVHHHLMDLRRVAEHAGVAGRRARRSSRTPGGSDAGDAVERFVDHRLHVHRHALAGAGAAEREDALDQRLGAHAGAHRGVDMAAHRRAVAGAPSAPSRRSRGSPTGCC